MAAEKENKGLYFGNLIVEGVKCFKDKEELVLTDMDGNPAQWTVILGNNGTGKTTLLWCLECIRPIRLEPQVEGIWPLYVALSETLGVVHSNLILKSQLHGDFRPPIELQIGFINPGGIQVTDYDDKYEDEIVKSQYVSYPVDRKVGEGRLTALGKGSGGVTQSRLTDTEEWLAQIDYAAQKKVGGAKERWEVVKKLLIDILPFVRDFKPRTTKDLKNYIEVTTEYGGVPLRDLSHGYQTMMALIVDLAKRMVERYPESKEPLKEPGVVLIDEIDLHLHPSWQRRIIADISKHFPNIQFIVTSHSPLVVQSAEKINVVVLQKAGDRVHIKNYPSQTFQGWTVEEILRDLMDLEEPYSDRYLELIRAFEKGVDEDDYNTAKAAYDELDKILYRGPGNATRKLLSIQMASLLPPEKV